MTSKPPVTEALNSLLRGELAAIETYSHAIHNDPAAGASSVLEKIRADHLHSVSVLRGLILARGGDPSTHSGPWGSFAKALEGAAAVVGSATAMTVLRQGEEHGIREYQYLLEQGEIEPEIRQIISTDLLPPLGEHLRDLTGLVE